MFAGYPDVVNVDQLREMLGGVGYKAAYGLLYDGSIVWLNYVQLNIIELMYS